MPEPRRIANSEVFKIYIKYLIAFFLKLKRSSINLNANTENLDNLIEREYPFSCEYMKKIQEMLGILNKQNQTILV